MEAVAIVQVRADGGWNQSVSHGNGEMKSCLGGRGDGSRRWQVTGWALGPGIAVTAGSGAGRGCGIRFLEDSEGPSGVMESQGGKGLRKERYQGPVCADQAPLDLTLHAQLASKGSRVGS